MNLGDCLNVKIIRQKISCIHLCGKPKTDAVKLKIIPQCAACQTASLRNIHNLPLMYYKFLSVKDKNRIALDYVAHHIIRDIGFRIGPSGPENIPVRIKKIEPHSGI